MNGKRKSFAIISIGVVNVLHAGLHIFQFVQSLMLVKASVEIQSDNLAKDHDFISEMLHSPYFTMVWGIVGIITLIIGVKDFIHHKKCSRE